MRLTFLLLFPAIALADTGLVDETTTLGAVKALTCKGSSLTCTRDGGMGTLTVTALAPDGGSLSGAGACTNQFVRATVANTSPTCGTVVLSTDTSGTLATGRGGTGGTATPPDGGLLYGAAGIYAAVGAGTAGQVLVSGGAGAPTWGPDSTTLNNKAAAGLCTNQFVRGADAGGLLCHAVVLASSDGGADDIEGVLPIASGGTGGSAAATSGGVAYGASSIYAFSGAGSAGQCLMSGGAGTPTWGSCGADGGAATSACTNQFVRGVNGALPPTCEAVVLTSDVTGTLAIASGGTNSTATATAGGLGYGNGTAHAYMSAGSSGQCAKSGGAGAPTWGTCYGGDKATGNAIVDLANMVAGNCHVNFTVSTTGATLAAGAVCSVAFALNGTGGVANAQYTAWPSDTNSVTIRACCHGGVDCDPVSQTYYVICTIP